MIINRFDILYTELLNVKYNRRTKVENNNMKNQPNDKKVMRSMALETSSRNPVTVNMKAQSRLNRNSMVKVLFIAGSRRIAMTAIIPMVICIREAIHSIVLSMAFIVGVSSSSLRFRKPPSRRLIGYLIVSRNCKCTG